MENRTLRLKPVDMNRENMAMLEERGMIRRLAPGKDKAGPVKGDNLGAPLYESAARHGGHKLIVATIDSHYLRYFGCHADREDIWLLGLDSYKPMYFVVATCLADEFRGKADGGTLTGADLVCLRARYNDPEASFFVMNPQVPHGEFVLPAAAEPPSFYVTEPAGMEIEPLSFGGYAVEVAADGVTLRVSPDA